MDKAPKQVPKVLGIDLGGSKVKLLYADLDSQDAEYDQLVLDTPTDSLDQFMNLVGPYLERENLESVVLTIPGIVDSASTTVEKSVNVPWLTGLNIAQEFGRFTSAKVGTIHDGRAAALAEATTGAGQNNDQVMVVTLGTGIASAYVFDGKIDAGAHGAAGELGHVVFGNSTTVCTCGQVGCLETVIGGKHLAQQWAQVIGKPSSAAQLCEAARNGDDRALVITNRAAVALSRAFLALIALHDPRQIVVGGGISHSWDVLVEPAIARTHSDATFHTVPPIVPAQLGMWAGAWGAVISARELVLSDRELAR